jgi:hypothetical protein
MKHENATPRAHSPNQAKQRKDSSCFKRHSKNKSFPPNKPLMNEHSEKINTFISEFFTRRKHNAATNTINRQTITSPIKPIMPS